jgi:hypothetical protein
MGVLMFKYFLPIFLLIFSIEAFAFTKERLLLKAGVSLSNNSVEALQDTTDNFIGIGFNTHFGYRKEWWEFSLSSLTQFGSLDTVLVSTSGQKFGQAGSFLDFSVSPTFKYHTNWQPKKGWGFYLGLGPTWSLQSIRQETVAPKTKITYQSFGGRLVLGIEEIMIIEDMHPVYLELSVGWRQSDKVSLVDVTNFSKVNTLSEASIGEDFTQTTIIISMGIMLF